MSRDGVVQPHANPATAIHGISAEIGTARTPIARLTVAVVNSPVATRHSWHSTRSAMMPPANMPRADPTKKAVKALFATANETPKPEASDDGRKACSATVATARRAKYPKQTRIGRDTNIFAERVAASLARRV